MTITDYKREHATEAAALAIRNYEDERRAVPVLPPVEIWPDLTPFADNGLGAVALEGGRLVGFLGVYPPFNNAFRSTHARGVFSPMEANGVAPENRAKIYAAMISYAAEKWVRAGAVSHAVCLYAHDTESQKQLFRYGFGLRCIDAVRPMEPISFPPCPGYTYGELMPPELPALYPLELALDAHMRQSPTFMNRKSASKEQFLRYCREEDARFFAAKWQGDICAYLKLVKEGETFITNRPDTLHIGGAYCLPEHRGRGVYSNLLNCAITALKSEGLIHLGVDFESINPTANGFWLKHFTAYTHNVVRRVDENCLEVFYHEL